MSWEFVRADQFCESVRDGTHDTPKEVECGYKLVTAKHIRDGQVYPNEAYSISEKDYIKINERSKVEQWDVVMSMIGNGLGRTAVIKDNPSYAIKNLALFKIGDEVKLTIFRNNRERVVNIKLGRKT
jgi:type I restriction enzyme S subunit